MRYFKVKYGFNPSDFVSIEEKDLERAVGAQVLGVPIQLGNSYINGKNIVSITPHWNRHTGWSPFYEPKDGDDWKQIQRDCPSYDGVIERAKERVQYLIQHGMKEKIGNSEPIPELEKQKKHKLSKEVISLSDKMRIK